MAALSCIAWPMSRRDCCNPSQLLPLSFFEPMMERLFAQPKNSIYKAAMQEHSPA